MLNKILSISLLIICLTVIFTFSNQNSTNSLKTSDNLTRNTIKTVSKVTGKKITEKEENKLIKDSRFIVRKCAHFTLYFILGLVVYYVLKSFNINNKTFIITIFICFICALFDEIHQIFTNRTFKILDIFIDTFASTISNLIIIKIKVRKTV